MQGDGSTALPHVSVPNISYVDWAALKRAGFEGAVFDKDNTLTEPYAIAIAPILVDSLRKCIQTFNGKVVLLSNSAGLEQFDPEGVSYQESSFKPLCILTALKDLPADTCFILISLRSSTRHQYRFLDALYMLFPFPRFQKGKGCQD